MGPVFSIYIGPITLLTWTCIHTHTPTRIFIRITTHRHIFNKVFMYVTHTHTNTYTAAIWETVNHFFCVLSSKNPLSVRHVQLGQWRHQSDWVTAALSDGFLLISRFEAVFFSFRLVTFGNHSSKVYKCRRKQQTTNVSSLGAP